MSLDANFKKSIIIIIIALTGLLSSALLAMNNKVYSLTIDGAISPANADYFIRGLNDAVENGASLLILNLNTPGGLDKSMRIIVQSILTSPVPVAVYISPKGARGASAGTYLMYASHIAAMAPATNLGSATPVTIDIMSPSLSKKKKEDQENPTHFENAPQAGSIMQQKMLNDARAYILSLAQLRKRNEKWAVESVTRAANLSANEALEKNVINFIADDQQALIQLLHQYEVDFGNHKITLQLDEPEIIEYQPDWRTELLIVITDPSIAYLLLLAGIYGLIFEFLNPGSLLPGTVGAVCLVMALYAFNLLPINLAGLALLLIGAALMISEAFVPSFGVLGLGGVTAFVLGSFMLMDSSLPGYQIAPALIISVSVFSALISIVVLSMILKSRRRPLVSGSHQLINHQAVAMEDFHGSGRVRIRGEIWQADCDQKIHQSQKVRVEAVHGLRLKVIAED